MGFTTGILPLYKISLGSSCHPHSFSYVLRYLQHTTFEQFTHYIPVACCWFLRQLFWKLLRLIIPDTLLVLQCYLHLPGAFYSMGYASEWICMGSAVDCLVICWQELFHINLMCSNVQYFVIYTELGSSYPENVPNIQISGVTVTIVTYVFPPVCWSVFFRKCGRTVELAENASC